MAAGVRAAIWSTAKACLASTLVGLTVADRYASLSHVRGSSMWPTFSESGDAVLMERLCLGRYDFSRGDVVVFRSPTDHQEFVLKRLIALPGDWIQVPDTADIRQIPKGHCWVEGDNSSISLDSRCYGPIPLGLMLGRVTHIVWPPHRVGRVERKTQEGRVKVTF